MADEAAALRKKWETIAAQHTDPAVKKRAQEVLAQLPAPEALPKAREPEPEPTAWDQIKTGASAVGRVAGPIVKNAVNGATLGSYNAFNDMVGLDSPTNRAEEDKAIGGVGADLAHGAGSAAGAIWGPMGLVGRGIGGLAGMLESRVPALAKSGLGRVGVQTAKGAATGATGNAITAANEGEDIADAAGRGAIAGGLAGGTLGGLGEGVKAVGSALGRTEAGKAAQILNPPPQYRDSPRYQPPSTQQTLDAQKLLQAKLPTGKGENASLWGGLGVLGGSLLSSHPGMAMAGVAAGMGIKNAAPITGRVLYPGAQAAGAALDRGAGTLGGGVAPDIDALATEAKAKARKRKSPKSPRKEM